MNLRPVHRARRFGRSIIARAPDQADTDWAHSFLQGGEQRLFDRMSAVDRAHSIGVARGVAGHLDRIGLTVDDPDARWVLTAALTHDVGKSVAGLGTYGRVVATLSDAVGGAPMARRGWSARRGMTRARWGCTSGIPGPPGRRAAGGGGLRRARVAWAAEHHEPEESWTVPLDAGRLLVAADDGAL